MDNELDWILQDVVLKPHAQVPDTFPAWAPSDVVEWLRKCNGQFPFDMVTRFVALVTDQRMKGVWEWHQENYGEQGTEDHLSRTAFAFCYSAHSSCQLPRFPGNLSAVERAKYFAKVREHAAALIELLSATQFGRNCERLTGMYMDEVDADRLLENVEKDLADWGDDETGLSP